MGISTSDLLAYAEKNAVDRSVEVELRSSMSRAYYAAFHALLPLVEVLPCSVKAKGEQISHFEVVERLSEWRVEDVCPALSQYRDVKGRLLRTMDAARAKRVMADYRLGQNVTLGEAVSQIKRVEQVLSSVNVLLKVMEGKNKDASQLG